MDLHCGKSAHFLYPLEHQTTDVNAVAWRCVVQAVIVCLCLVLQHCRAVSRNIVTDQILTDDYNNDTGWSYVLLYTEVDQTVIRYIDWL